MTIMQAKGKSSYQTEDEKRGNNRKNGGIQRSLMPDRMLNTSYQAYRLYRFFRADKAFTPHPPVHAD
ncbi:hypothetical protein BED03_18280 [Escherichia coli]|nr:hypothetical protein [Escherichia coli]MCH6724541.1 hypothetical protein [Escherichia coli]MIA43212.1 hypothetical protein [Escherichia coli]